jgi:choice-of-anchor B domain-containing protein
MPCRQNPEPCNRSFSISAHQPVFTNRTTLFMVCMISLLFYSCTDSGQQPIIDESDISECINGMAGPYPCSNIGLYAVLTTQQLLSEPAGELQPRLNDIWGWIDPLTEKEYALVGLSDGVSIVDVTEPSEPVVMAKLLDHITAERRKTTSARFPLQLNHDEEDGFKEASIWRDLKVYQNTLYVVSEQGDAGLQVFDLTRIRDIESPPVMLTEDYVYSLFGNSHNIAINEETGYAYAVGSTSGDVCAERGGLHMISLSENPLQPEFAGCYFEEEAGGRIRNGYIHDTQCVIYRGPDSNHSGREICFSSSELTFTITDVDDKQNPFTIFNSTYDGNAYSHQGWLTEDQHYFFMNDELDELTAGNNTRTYVWDVRELESAEMIGFYEHSTEAVDHNLYIHNNIMYQANYTSGLRVLDVSNPLPEAVQEIGFFDTTPGNNRAEFEGLWSVYPWLSGDKVIVSDIRNGLFILKVEGKN